MNPQSYFSRTIHEASYKYFIRHFKNKSMIERQYEDRSDIYIERMKHQIIQQLTLIITDHQLASTQKIDAFIRDNQTQSDNLKNQIQLLKKYFGNKQGSAIKEENKRPKTITFLSESLSLLNKKLEAQQKQILEIKKELSQVRIPSNKIPKSQYPSLQKYKIDYESLMPKQPYQHSFLHINDFNFESDGTIIKKWNGLTQLCGNETIKNKPTTQFQILNMHYNSIAIGILHQSYTYDKCALFQQRKQCIRYDINTGQIWVSGSYKGKAKPIHINQSVMMQVSHKQVTWRVGHQIRAQVKCQLIQEDRWVPYILMRNKKDALKWK